MLKVAYTDDYLMVIDKPPGLVVTSSETQKEPTLEDMLRQDYRISLDRSGIVHRLDKDTSGLMIIAKRPEAFENLQSQFKERTINKEYLALVHGWLEKAGRVDVPIGRNPGDREKFVADASIPNVREAVTKYEPINNFQFSIFNFQSIFNDLNKNQSRKLERNNYGQFTLLRCKPLTGRTHQIRVHLKYIGFPIVADEKYGGRKTTRLDHRWCKRQFLHAAKLEFAHPKTGDRMQFESELPEDLKEALGILEKV